MNYQDFIKYFKNRTKIDLNLYKEAQMKRRLETFIAAEIGEVNYSAFIDKLNKDKDLFSRLKDRITINVTEFYRNPNVWNRIKDVVIPELIKDKKTLTIWSAACSSGEEPYSLAMLLNEHFKNINWKILATDLDETILNKASRGIYGEYQISSLDPKLKEKYFTEVDLSNAKHGDGFVSGESIYEISKDLKKKVVFKQHNLLADEFPKDVDLILCRNVVIYFTEESKAVLYEKFYNTLRKDGMIVIGSTEHIANYSKIGFDKFEDWIFKK